MSEAKVIRVIHAADNETIEVHWRRARIPGSPLADTLIMRYTSPPATVWEARLADPDPTLPFEETNG